MNRKKKLLLCLTLIASVMTLVTCKPIDYYLQRVYKAYGKATDAKTGQPLESVEVFVKGYQYSELTNDLGDYEIELAEGTWTLEFVKDGYDIAESDPPSRSAQRILEYWQMPSSRQKRRALLELGLVLRGQHQVVGLLMLD